MQPGLSLEYKIPESILLNENHDYRMFIEFKTIMPNVNTIYKEICIKQNSCLLIEGKENISFDFLISSIFAFQALLLIAMMTPTHILKIEGETNEKIYNLDKGNYYGKVLILYSSPDYLIKEVTIAPDDMLFTISEIRSDITNYLSNWINNYNKLNLLTIYFFVLYFFMIFIWNSR